MDELRVNVEPKENFEDAIDKMAEVIKGCALMYSIATKRPAEEYVQSLISRVKFRPRRTNELPNAN